MPDSKRSQHITQNVARSPNHSMYYALNYIKDDFDNPTIGVANNHSTITPCNSGLQKLADATVAAIKDARANPQIFGTPAISDGMSMGTEGMEFSLISREVIADCIKTYINGQWMDGVVVIGGCDKDMPGGVIALAHTNVLGIYVYGGTIKPGYWKGRDLTIVSSFEAVGKFTAGRMSEEDFEGIEKNACSSSGSCGGMYTVNTMNSSSEALGMSLLYSSAMANPDQGKVSNTAESARVLIDAVHRDPRPRDVIARKSIEDAVAVITTTGGSANAMSRHLAITHTTEVEWTIDDFERVRQRVPVICSLKPSGQYVATDLHKAGDIPQVMKLLLNAGLLHGNCIIVTDRTLAEEPAHVPDQPRAGQNMILLIDKASYKEGHLAILKGNLAEEGAMAKITELKDPVIAGPACMFENKQGVMSAILGDQIKVGDILVLRYLEPKDGPGMPEMLAPIPAIIGKGLDGPVDFIIDGRFSGGTWDMVVGHVAPEACVGGTTGLVHKRDSITIGAHQWLLQLDMPDGRLARRHATWKRPAPRYTRDVLTRFTKLAATANEGAVAD